MSLPPGPRLPALLQTWAWIRRPLPFLDDCARRFGGRFTLRFVGGRDYVLVTDPEDVKAVFTGSPEALLAGRANAAFAPFLGEHSLFVLDGAAHRRHRKLLMPPFQGERMRAYGPLIRDVTLAHAARWPRGRRFSAIEPVHRITLEVILRAVFGVTDPARLRRTEKLIAQATGRSSAILAFMRPLHVDLGPWSPWGRFLAVRRALDAVLFEEIARARREQGAGREDILAKLIEQSAEQGDPLADLEVRDELLTMLVAGHGTTTAGLAWALQWILGDPQVRERAQAEVREVVGDGSLEMAHLSRLRYLDAAVQETLRISPPVPVVPRWLAAPVRVGGHDLPAGTYLTPCPYLAQRDSARYPEPLRFRPERFLEGRPGPFDLFTFGGGGRTCIGLAFATFEMKVVLATLLSAHAVRLAAPATHRSRRFSILTIPAHRTPIAIG